MPGPNQDAQLYDGLRGETPPGPAVPQHLQDEYDRLNRRFQELKNEEQHEAPGCAEDLLAVHAGLDMTSEHGKETPRRFLGMLGDLTSHKNCDESCIKWKTFDGDVDEMIVVKQIPFQSVCNHHVIPFVGHAWVGYVPQARIVGLSKFARVVEHFSRRLQVQERLTQQVHNYIHLNLHTRGIIVRMEAEHMCMTIRGAQAPGVTTVTTKCSGVFADHARTAKMEFLEAIK
jgi:GTP cyclohydrolase I